MSVPAVVEAGSEDIILDCDFDCTEEEKNQLDIKWYFNSDPEPIYQWIPSHPGQKGPQVFNDLFREHLDLDFEVNEDPLKKHRALLIKNPLPQFSGTYMCKVSSFVDEDFDQKDLLIYGEFWLFEKIYSTVEVHYTSTPLSFISECDFFW